VSIVIQSASQVLLAAAISSLVLKLLKAEDKKTSIICILMLIAVLWASGAFSLILGSPVEFAPWMRR